MKWPQDILSEIKRLPESVKWVVGIDEVGRGAIAGPMVLGICAIRRGDELELERMKNLDDSKKLTANSRQKILSNIKSFPDHISIEIWSTRISAAVVDRIRIRQSYLTMMNRVVKQYDPAKTIFLMDYGIPIPNNFIHWKSYKKGDATIPVIALASIYAKEKRDKYMKNTVHQRFPGYGFDKHVGYGTQWHRLQIRKHGTCDQHRKTWIK
jgi:ribonuclease HII